MKNKVREAVEHITKGIEILQSIELYYYNHEKVEVDFNINYIEVAKSAYNAISVVDEVAEHVNRENQKAAASALIEMLSSKGKLFSIIPYPDRTVISYNDSGKIITETFNMHFKELLSEVSHE